jgi:hypothetical protein
MKKLYLYNWNETKNLEPSSSPRRKINVNDLEWDWEEDEPLSDHEKLRNEFAWTTAEGSFIYLKNLKTNHIRHIINYVKRNKDRYKDKFDVIISAMESELKYRKGNKKMENHSIRESLGNDKSKLKDFVKRELWDEADKEFDRISNKYWNESKTMGEYDRKMDELKTIYPDRYKPKISIDSSPSLYNKPKQPIKPQEEKMIDILLKPSGEIIEVSEEEFEELNEFFEFEYIKEYDCYWIEDDLRDGIISILYYFKK